MALGNYRAVGIVVAATCLLVAGCGVPAVGTPTPAVTVTATVTITAEPSSVPTPLPSASPTPTPSPTPTSKVTAKPKPTPSPSTPILSKHWPASGNTVILSGQINGTLTSAVPSCSGQSPEVSETGVLNGVWYTVNVFDPTDSLRPGAADLEQWSGTNPNVLPGQANDTVAGRWAGGRSSEENYYGVSTGATFSGTLTPTVAADNQGDGTATAPETVQVSIVCPS